MWDLIISVPDHRLSFYFTLRGASYLVLSCSLYKCVFCPFSILIILLGEVYKID